MSSYNNPYASPSDSSQAVGNFGTQLRLAGLDKRFLGAIFDALVSFAAVIPGVVLIIVDVVRSGEQSQLGVLGIAGIGLSIVAMLILVGVQLYLLVTRSQTIGKYLIKTQIVDFETSQPAGFVKSFILRSFVSGLIGGIPMVGSIYSIVDILFVFRSDRRCIHDMIAGTVVVDVG